MIIWEHSSGVEQNAVNIEVGGSNPSAPANIPAECNVVRSMTVNHVLEGADPSGWTIRLGCSQIGRHRALNPI